MTSVADAPAVLIAALSGRALAACARRGLYRPLVADLFGDLDTRELAEASERVPGSLGHGFLQEALLEALDRLAAGRNPIGVVVGTGFEDRPGVLQAVAARHRLLGNAAEIVVAIKDPMGFAALCARAEVPHPEVRREQPSLGEWVRKRAGGSGGAHIVAMPRRGVARPGQYYQQRVGGVPVSAAFLAARGRCHVLGLSRQWADPAPRRPFRFGGAARPAAIAPALAAQIHGALSRLVPHTGLCGLNSADFMVREDGIDLLEVNPRPGATLDIFADRDGALFRQHVDACAGVLPSGELALPPGSAAAIVFARSDIRIAADFVWPAWTADRQPQGETVPRGAPVCTVMAEAEDAAAAECLVRQRAAQILAGIA